MRLTIATLLFFFSFAIAQAQTQDPGQQLTSAIRTTVERLRGNGAPLSAQADSVMLVLALGVRDDQLLAAAEENRTDKQLGADGRTAGSTSLVSKGGIPRILAFAVENGGLEETQSGTTVTFRGTPAGIIRTLADKGYLQTTVRNDPAVRVLQKFAFGVSFDTSRGVDSGDRPTFTGSNDQLSAVSGRFSILDQRDPRRAQYDPQWNMLASGVGVSAAAAAGSFVAAALGDAAFTAWLTAARNALAAAPMSAYEVVIRDQLRELRTAGLAPNTLAAAATLRSNYDLLLAQRQRILDDAARGAQLVLDYTNDRSANGEDTSNVRLVASVGQQIDLTGNVSATFFNGTLPSATTKRLRDFQGALQLDIPLGRAETTGRYVLAFAYKIEHVLNDIVSVNGITRKGLVSVGQLKLTIPVKDTAVRIPVSVTFANRSELVKEKVVRGNVGVTYDLDAVFARFKP